MQTITRQRKVAFGLLAVLGTAGLTGLSAQPASANSKTWKKVAIGAGAVTAYGLITGKGKVATIGGLVTAGSYLKYRHDKKKERQRAAWRRRHSRYYYRHR
jgi:hypothetical protein